MIHPWSDDALPLSSAGRKISAPLGALEQSNRAAALERSWAIVSRSSMLVDGKVEVSSSAPETPAAHAVGRSEALSRHTVTVASTIRLLPGASAHSIAPLAGRAPGTPTAASIELLRNVKLWPLLLSKVIPKGSSFSCSARPALAA